MDKVVETTWAYHTVTHTLHFLAARGSWLHQASSYTRSMRPFHQYDCLAMGNIPSGRWSASACRGLVTACAPSSSTGDPTPVSSGVYMHLKSLN